MRVVFDTNTVISALLFGGSAAWLVDHWQSGVVIPLISRETAEEFLRVLGYPKFGLSADKIERLVARYLPFAECVEHVDVRHDLPQCRDAHDQKFIELAVFGHADILVSGDADVLALRDQLPFTVQTLKEYRMRSSPRA